MDSGVDLHADNCSKLFRTRHEVIIVGAARLKLCIVVRTCSFKLERCKILYFRSNEDYRSSRTAKSPDRTIDQHRSALPPLGADKHSKNLPLTCYLYQTGKEFNAKTSNPCQPAPIASIKNQRIQIHNRPYPSGHLQALRNFLHSWSLRNRHQNAHTMGAKLLPNVPG